MSMKVFGATSLRFLLNNHSTVSLSASITLKLMVVPYEATEEIVPSEPTVRQPSGVIVFVFVRIVRIPYFIMGCQLKATRFCCCLESQYDCSSADINPIGGISKGDLRAFLRWGALNLGYQSLAEVEGAPPTAELEPITENYSQVNHPTR